MFNLRHTIPKALRFRILFILSLLGIVALFLYMPKQAQAVDPLIEGYFSTGYCDDGSDGYVDVFIKYWFSVLKTDPQDPQPEAPVGEWCDAEACVNVSGGLAAGDVATEIHSMDRYPREGAREDFDNYWKYTYSKEFYNPPDQGVPENQSYNLEFTVFFSDGSSHIATGVLNTPSETCPPPPPPPPPPSDTTPPAAITDLAASSPTASSILLAWTAPGDEGNGGGAASQYDIRYSASAITGANWNSATQATGEPAPASPGTSQSMVIGGLASNTTYFFAMKTADEVPNWSTFSNSPSATTLAPANVAPIISSVTETDAPDPVIEGNIITFTVNWTDAGDSTKIHICKTDAISGQTCSGGSWCDTGSFSASTPTTCPYTPPIGGATGKKDYFAFVCDDEDACSASTASTSGDFTVAWNGLCNALSGSGNVAISTDCAVEGEAHLTSGNLTITNATITMNANSVLIFDSGYSITLGENAYILKSANGAEIRKQ